MRAYMRASTNSRLFVVVGTGYQLTLPPLWLSVDLASASLFKFSVGWHHLPFLAYDVGNRGVAE